MTVALVERVLVSSLVERFGGSAPGALSSPSISTLATPWERVDGDDVLIPVARPRACRALTAAHAVLLAPPDLARRLPAERTWVHERPSDVVDALLRDVVRAGLPDERALAHVDPSVVVPASAKVGAFAVLRAGCTIGEHAVIGAHAVVHDRVVVGERVVIGDGAVIGGQGFGWAITDGGARRVPQLGGVVLEPDVEIGPLATVDAGTIGPTVIGQGVKLDAHVHVGHNVYIGAHTIVAAQSGFAGSARIGRGVLIGGQVGVPDHAEIGDGAKLAARAGVIGDVAAGATFAGYPAVPRSRWLRAHVALYRR